MGRKMNCWTFKKCGRGPRGTRVKELGQCPAASFIPAEGLNGGTNGGRMCWAIAGIYSLTEEKRSCSDSGLRCYDCDFHRKVLLEEGIIKPHMLTSHRRKASISSPADIRP